MDRTAEDILQDRRLAALETSVKEIGGQLELMSAQLRNINVRIDRTTPAPSVGFLGFLLRLFGK